MGVPKRASSKGFSSPGNQSPGILDDHAVRKNIASREGTVEKIPVNDSDIANKKYVDSAVITQQIENKAGSDCDGLDGSKNRVLTLNNTAITTAIITWINGTFLHPGQDYTINHLAANSTITFLNNIDNPDYISIFYFT